MNTLVGARSARPFLSTRILTAETSAASPPCAEDPGSWDVDIARPSELIAAAEQCVGCPIFKACQRDAQAGAAASMVWAGTIYDEHGNAVDAATVRTWKRHNRAWGRRSPVVATGIAS